MCFGIFSTVFLKKVFENISPESLLIQLKIFVLGGSRMLLVRYHIVLNGLILGNHYYCLGLTAKFPVYDLIICIFTSI